MYTFSFLIEKMMHNACIFHSKGKDTVVVVSGYFTFLLRKCPYNLLYRHHLNGKTKGVYISYMS